MATSGKVRIQEGTVPATPPTGYVEIWYDDATSPGVLKVVKDDASVVTIESVAGADADAIHDNVAGEISLITEKASPVSADLIIIEDSAAANVKKRVQIGNLPTTDAAAIHDNVAAEISAITEKVTLVGADLLLIEDSEAANAKKKVQISNLPAGSLPATVVETDQANTYTTGAQDFSSATSLKVPVSAGAAPTASGEIAYDSTAKTLEYGDDGTNRVVVNLDEVQGVSQKGFSNCTVDSTCTVQVKDSNLNLYNGIDPTKEAAFDFSPIETGTVKVYSFPDATGTIALTSNKLSAFAATTSAELAGVISDETGSGALVFADSPTLVTPALGTPASGVLTNCTGLPDGALSANVVLENQANTWSTGAQDFSAATSLTVPVAAGAAPTVSGQIAYDSTANQLEYGDNGTNRVVANLNETQEFTNKTMNSSTNFIDANQVHFFVWNDTGVAITKGKAVFISGFNVPNSLPTIALADSDAGATMPAIGLVESDIADGASGEVVIGGVLTGTGGAPLDTSGFSVANPLYVSGTAGVLTATEPVGSALIQRIGICVRAHVTLGQIAITGNRQNAVPNFTAPENLFYGGTAGAHAEFTMGAGIRTFLTTPTSANLITAVTDETGSGALVFGTGPTINGSTLTGVHDAGAATSFEAPNGAGGTTVDAAGKFCVDTTSRTWNFHDGTAEVVLNPVHKASVTIESPTTSDDVTLFHTDVAVTVTKVAITVVGTSTPSWTADVRHHTSRNNAGNALITSPTASTEAGNSAESTGHIITSFDDATIPANSWVWVETDAQSGTWTNGGVSLTIFYKQDP